MSSWCLFPVFMFTERTAGCFWCVLCTVPGGVQQTDVSVFSRNQTGWADHMPSEVAARKCSHRLRGIETLSPPPSRLSILLNRKTVCLIWFISLVLIYWPVLLCLSVVWAKPAWEELQGNWLYWKFNQRSQEVTKMQSVGEGNQAGCSGLSSNLILLMLHPLTNNTSRHTPYYRSNCSLQPVGKKRDSHLISMIIIWMHNVHLGYRKSHVIPVI